MKCKYNIKEVIESLDFANDYENKDAVKEVLCFIVEELTTQAKVSQAEMDYEERISHNWTDYAHAKALRDFCLSLLCDLGVE